MGSMPWMTSFAMVEKPRGVGEEGRSVPMEGGVVSSGVAGGGDTGGGVSQGQDWTQSSGCGESMGIMNAEGPSSIGLGEEENGNCKLLVQPAVSPS
jgi:hypothetical protein